MGELEREMLDEEKDVLEVSHGLYIFYTHQQEPQNETNRFRYRPLTSKEAFQVTRISTLPSIKLSGYNVGD